MSRPTLLAERASPGHCVDAGLALVLVLLSSACEPKLFIGAWTCPVPDASPLAALEVPWTTGFENGFCDYTQSGGACYANPDATYKIVDSPVHGGRQAAAFTVTTDSSKNGDQARCYLQGALPIAASYGAWFYLPSAGKNASNWNLVHFQGGAVGARHNLWDVSIATAADGTMSLYLYDSLGNTIRTPKAAPPVPVGQWFHVEFSLMRAKDATGEVALYQDGVLLMDVAGIVTDDTDLAQWYVGNFAGALTPQDSTLYVDDVTIHAAP